MRVTEATTDAERADAFSVRRDVFVEEQGVPEDVEWDDYDEAERTRHFVAYDGETPVGAARLRPADDDAGKVERVATLKERREEGIGGALMEALEDAARGEYDRLVLHAQTHAESFYLHLGYETTSDVFDEAGIPHVEMEKRLNRNQ
ncbi:GNAT family N-acetyltransferase [Salarchaeum sp. JOR-1]|uniref:GNAT family N-acetyltransferase n=1 Tax=Salarchaeum sp. JOR-1 TaxID=2599399 RepID=UPI001198B3B8|nr:GNAT family N-acetyltransferase [Salarchaeum sp. JOR-1]QDX41215.1 GNAT family N-acetyltransferase [Salarchaeum sp. JOR-1]